MLYRSALLLPFIFLFSFFFFLAEGEELPDPAPQSEEEALFVRRIVEFWRDEEFAFVEGQINRFFQEYPDSAFIPSFYVLLGDLAFREQKYVKALSFYEKVTLSSLQQKFESNKVQALYQLQRYPELIAFLRPFVMEEQHRNRFENRQREFYTFVLAEAYFRYAPQLPDQTATSESLRQAALFFERLEGSHYYEKSLIALAEISRELEEHEAAARYFLKLAELREGDREDLLYEAASIQMAFDKEKAAATFSKIFEGKGARAADAAFNWMLLMYSMERYDIITESVAKLLECVPEAKRPMTHFILGNSFFSLKEYEEAAENLESYLSTEEISSRERKDALMMLSASGYYLDDVEVVFRSVGEMEKLFAHDPRLPKALFFRGLLSKRHREEQQAEKDLERILREYPDFEENELVFFELSALYYQEGKWAKSHEAFSSFIESYPESSYHSGARRFLLYASMHLVDDGVAKVTPQLRWQLVHDIQKGLQSDSVIEEEQLPGYRLKLGKTLFELSAYDDALEVLDSFLENHPLHPDLFQVHLLIALCQRDGKEDLAAFIFHAEKVLELKKKFRDEGTLRLSLFTAYLERSEEVKEYEEKEYLLNHASEHLYLVVIAGEEAIQLRNKIWLANFYYESVRHYMEKDWQRRLEDSGLMTKAERARKVFERALVIEEGDFSEPLGEHRLFLEPEYYRFAKLLGWMHFDEKKIAVLTFLKEQQEAYTELSWKLRAMTLIDLAEALEQGGRLEEAYQIYQNVAVDMVSSDPFLLKKAQLQTARLSYALLPEGQKSQVGASLSSILTVLKDLKARKKLADEPLHLEAAIDFAEIQGSVGEKEQQSKRLLFYLKQLKEEFTLHDDIWSKDYNSSRELMPEKDVVYQAYIMLVDAWIALLQAGEARKVHSYHEAESKESAAQNLFVTLLKGDYAVTPYLVNKAKEGLDLLESRHVIKNQDLPTQKRFPSYAK